MACSKKNNMTYGDWREQAANSPESRTPTMTSALDLSRDGSQSLSSGSLSPSSNPRNCQDLVVCGAHLPSLRKADTTSLLSAGGRQAG